MKLRYKIISFSSQEPSAPMSNLLSGSGAWESSRFCEYPQQITFQFYDPIVVETILITSHPTKISSRVNILFCMPDRSKIDQNYKFEKYGYFQFGDNEKSEYKLRESKKIQNVNRNAQYMRLILWKNHQNTFNFFNQVGLSQVAIFGTPVSETGLLMPLNNNRSILLNLSSSEFIENKLEVLEQFKQEFSKADDFESAKQIKQIMKVIKAQGQKLKQLQKRKKEAIEQQNYEQAKLVKVEIEEVRKQVEYLSSNFYDPNKKLIKPILKDSKLKLKIEEISDSGNSSLQASRVTNKSKKKVALEILDEEKESISEQENDEGEQQKEQKEDEPNQDGSTQRSRVAHENKIVPAVLHKNKKDLKTILNSVENLEDAAYEDNQFIEKYNKNEEENVLEEMTPSAEANASILLQLFDRQIVKKLHSKNWNYKLQAITHISEQSVAYLKANKKLQKNRVRSILFTVNKCIKQGSFPIVIAALDLLNALSVQTKNSEPASTQEIKADLHKQIQKSIVELFLKMGDSQKIKQKADEILRNMSNSELYGVPLLFSVIAKSYFNQSLTHNAKIKKYKLGAVESMVLEQGVGGVKNGLPNNSIEFVCRAAEDSNGQVRKQATLILKLMKERVGGNKVIQIVRAHPEIKASILKQLQA